MSMMLRAICIILILSGCAYIPPAPVDSIFLDNLEELGDTMCVFGDALEGKEDSDGCEET